MAKEWFAYNYIEKIAKIERHNNPKKSIKGEFFETWDEAWSRVNEQATERLHAAQKQLVDAERHLCNVGKMKAPNVQIEGLADHKAWPEPRKFNNRRPQRERLSASPSRMQG